jgi:hypothetical protein
MDSPTPHVDSAPSSVECRLLARGEDRRTSSLAAASSSCVLASLMTMLSMLIPIMRASSETP